MGTRITLRQGDITHEKVDAIVNAANSGLLGGGGVDGAIHRAAGPALLAACREIVEAKGSCPPGEAVITAAGQLNAKYVIHTVGPVWRGGSFEEASVLARCYRNSLALAEEHGCTTIAFPAISTGVYRYPVLEAARVALSACRSFISEQRSQAGLAEIRFILFSAESYKVFENTLGAYG